jgi:hypothetical protein
MENSEATARPRRSFAKAGTLPLFADPGSRIPDPGQRQQPAASSQQPAHPAASSQQPAAKIELTKSARLRNSV